MKAFDRKNFIKVVPLLVINYGQKDFEIKKDYPIFFEKIQEKTVLNTKYRKSPMIPIGDKYLV